MSDEKKRTRRKEQPAHPKRLTEQQISAMGEIFTGFDTWYRANYDADGNLVKPQQTPAQEVPDEL